MDEKKKRELYIIEGKVTDAVSQKDKKDAWGRIAESYNSAGENFRDINSLKIKFDNVKRTLKLKVAQAQQNFKGTGGGPANSIKLLWYEEQLCAHLKISISGLPSVGGSDGIKNLPISEVSQDKEQINEEFQEISSNVEHISSPAVVEVPPSVSKVAETPSMTQSDSDGNKRKRLSGWNLKRTVNRNQKQNDVEDTKKLVSSKIEICALQKECYEQEKNKNILGMERERTEWEIKRKILEIDLKKKEEEYLEIVEERKRKKILFEMEETEKKIKLDLLKCELNKRLRENL